MSGVSAMDSHSMLQYFPVSVMHEQIGCAHFFPIAAAICFLRAPGEQLTLLRVFPDHSAEPIISAPVLMTLAWIKNN
jgi:hypothetical protein